MRRARVLAMSLYGGLVASNGPLPLGVGCGLVLFCFIGDEIYVFLHVPTLNSCEPPLLCTKKKQKSKIRNRSVVVSLSMVSSIKKKQ